MTCLESLKQKGFVISLGRNGLKIPKNMPIELRRKVEAKKDIIVSEILGGESPLLKEIRKKRKAACESCGNENDLEPFPGSDWYWYSCSCGYSKTIEMTQANKFKAKVMGDGCCLLDTAVGKILVIRDSEVVLPKKLSGFVKYSLSECLALKGCGKEALITFHNAKINFGGEISNDSSNLFREAA